MAALLQEFSFPVSTPSFLFVHSQLQTLPKAWCCLYHLLQSCALGSAFLFLISKGKERRRKERELLLKWRESTGMVTGSCTIGRAELGIVLSIELLPDKNGSWHMNISKHRCFLSVNWCREKAIIISTGDPVLQFADWPCFIYQYRQSMPHQLINIQCSWFCP